MREAIITMDGSVLEAGMGVTELSKVTGWKTEYISHWISQGLLKSEQVKLRGQQRYVVLPEHLLEYAQTYIPLADLAKIMSTKASALSRNLKGAVEPANMLTKGERELKSVLETYLARDLT